MKKVICSVMVFAACLALATASINAQDAQELINKSKQATLSKLKRCKTKGVMTTGSSGAIHNEGAFDYERSELSMTQKKDAEVVSETYFKDKALYLYTAVDGVWRKFASGSSTALMLGSILDKEKIFSTVPDDFTTSGFKVTLKEEETIEGEPCFVIHGVIVDREKAKTFMSNQIEAIFPAQVMAQIRANEEFYNKMLETMTKEYTFTQWVSKKTFFVKKVFMSFYQLDAGGSEALMESEYVYYDHNAPFSVELPPEAKDAQEMPTTF